ncbi:MAG: hypothetical protein J6Y72_05505 [Bacteroidales bacterium]|nr:hypothetical protein [Bacteroidales bacterium]
MAEKYSIDEMMKIFEFIIRSFCTIAGGSGIHRLEKAITLANIFFLCNIVAVLNWIIGNATQVVGVHIYPNDGSISQTSICCGLLVYGICIAIIGFVILRLLRVKYLNKFGYLRIMKIEMSSFVSITILIMLYIEAIFFMGYSYSFWS